MSRNNEIVILRQCHTLRCNYSSLQRKYEELMYDNTFLGKQLTKQIEMVRSMENERTKMNEDMEKLQGKYEKLKRKYRRMRNKQN